MLIIISLWMTGCEEKNSITSLDSEQNEIENLLLKAKKSADEFDFSKASNVLKEVRKISSEQSKEFKEVANYIVQKENDYKHNRNINQKKTEETKQKFQSIQSLNRCLMINNMDSQNSCIAIASNNESRCYSIKDKDKLNYCLAITKLNENRCYNIENKNLQNSCIAITKSSESLCYNIKNKDLQNNCLAITTSSKSWCYNIQNHDMEKACIISIY